MDYQFPVIRNISDVLPAIEGRSEFVVAVKDGYTVINYNVMMADTFPDVWQEVILHSDPDLICSKYEENVEAALRRECRGIIFDTATGDILRRPFHKFFNVNEREETQEHRVNLSYVDTILEKLDGSMIAPFFNQGVLVFGTKMGATDVAKPVEEFADNNPHYIDFSRDLIDRGYTPIFEWCSRKQRIVLDYKEDQLILTAVRHIETGVYVDYSWLQTWSVDYGIPVVRAFSPETDMSAFLAYVRDLEDLEGFVSRFADGHMVKLKCDWYVQIHKAKEKILQDRNIVEIILDEKLDDVKAHLPAEDRDRLTQFESEINRAIRPLALSIVVQVSNCQRFGGMDRKTFAIEYAPRMDAFSRPIAFAMWDDVQYTDAVDICEGKVRSMIRNNLGRTAKYEEIRSAWFPGVVFNV
jgi:T4 RnlA family RNA ligase